MKRYVLLFCLLVVLVLALSFGASAQSTPDIPDDIQVFYVDGKTIVRDTVFGGMIFWCTGECGENGEECDECKQCPTPTPPTETPTPPTDTPTPPTDTPTPPTPTDTPTPPPPKKTKANCGLGNYDEGADPNDNACGKKTGEENEPDGPPGQQKNNGTGKP